jgi:anti-sigma regulatory factor (Ser/Thr protein kinase)
MPASASTLVHQAFLYESRESFVAELAPFVRRGIEDGDTLFAATTPSNIAALREELGSDAARVEFQDTADWCVHPYERVQAFRRIVDALPAGTALRAMGEPLWSGSDAAVRQWARYESIIDLAFPNAPVRFICLYDGAGLPDHILDHARHTHHERVEDGAAVACETYVAPEEFVPGRAATPRRGAHAVELSGAGFRRTLAERALELGLAPERVDDLVIAANEVATNAVRHGAPPSGALVWAEGPELVCQIADAGVGIHDPLAGWLPPAPDAEGGWGLAIARQLCDALEITPGDPGATVALHMSLS